MSEKDRANELNTRLGGDKTRRNVSTLDANVRAIERLISVAADEDAGLISVYRALDEEEKRALQPFERDEIANAYHVELAGDDRAHYITYKPAVARGGSGKLEHVNRSTPFVQSLLDKISNEYSFLYCRSKVRETDVPMPPAAHGFRITQGETEHLEGKNKYELFFLIECKDGIDASERIVNIIDSVLIDVDGASDDFFARMSYAPLEHGDGESDEEIPYVEPAVQKQLNDIITQIRTSSAVRGRIADFLARNEQSELYAHLFARNRAFTDMRAVAPQEVNAFNSTVTCRMLPIGVFLNVIDNDRIPYTVTGGKGESATFYTELNPAAPFSAHVCPHCGKPLGEDNGAAVVSTRAGYAVGCESCASKCAHKNCGTYAFDSEGCTVCHKILCPAHLLKSADSDDGVCRECARVFRDSVSGKPLSPRDAAVRGEKEHYVDETLGRMGKTGAFTHFRAVKLMRKSAVTLCKCPDGAYRYYLKNEAVRCGGCGENFYKEHVKKTRDTGEKLCADCRVDCACGKTVAKRNAHLCENAGCTHGFCDSCYKKRRAPRGYGAAVKLLDNEKIPVAIGDKTYCNEHVAVCKVCGKTVPLSAARVCGDCGGVYCDDCAAGEKCRTCGTADQVNGENYKALSSRTRRARLNALPFNARLGKIAVLEDHENIVFVTVAHISFLRSKPVRRIHNKLTGKTEVLR